MVVEIILLPQSMVTSKGVSVVITALHHRKECFWMPKNAQLVAEHFLKMDGVMLQGRVFPLNSNFMFMPNKVLRLYCRGLG